MTMNIDIYDPIQLVNEVLDRFPKSPIATRYVRSTSPIRRVSDGWAVWYNNRWWVDDQHKSVVDRVIMEMYQGAVKSVHERSMEPWLKREKEERKKHQQLVDGGATTIRWEQSEKYRELKKEMPKQRPPYNDSKCKSFRSCLLGDSRIPIVSTPRFHVMDGEPGRNYVPFRQGLLDLDYLAETGKMKWVDHTPAYFSTVLFDVEFDKDAGCEEWEKLVGDFCEWNPDKIRVFQQFCGYILINNQIYQKFLCLDGDGNNGKTAIFRALSTTLGKPAVSHVTLEDFHKNFMQKELSNSMLNISDDSKVVTQHTIGYIKQYTSNSAVQIDIKYRDPMCCVPTTKLIMAFNGRPHFRDMSDGLWRRLIYLKTNFVVSPDQKNPHFTEQLFWESRKVGILTWMVKGAVDLLQNGGFSITSELQDAVSRFKGDSNYSETWLREWYEKGEGYVCGKKIYSEYKKWCADTNQKPQNYTEFKLMVEDKMGADTEKRVDNKRVWWGIVRKVMVDEKI